MKRNTDAGRSLFVMTALGVVAGLALLPSGAAAAPRASVSWTPPRAVSASAPIPFTWSGSHLGRGHRLVVQRRVGTAHTWQTIMRLPGNKGSAELPGLPLGKYRLRLADLSGGRVLAKQAMGIAVFGEVPFSVLLKGSTDAGVYATSQSSFPYVASWGFTGSNTVFKVKSNHCQSVHIAFVTADHDGSIVGTVSVVQETREAVSVSAPGDTIASLDAELVPGQSWAVNASLTPNRLYEVYFNGYAVCDSTESFAS